MRVKMKTILAGPSGNAQPGQEIDLPRDQAIALVRAGSADLVDRAEPVETATVTAPEKAVVKPRRRAGRVKPDA